MSRTLTVGERRIPWPAVRYLMETLAKCMMCCDKRRALQQVDHEPGDAA
jgi:hypothetical protein